MNQNSEQDIVTVSQLTMDIKYYLEEKFFSLWVSGEVFGLSRPASGHTYFSLKDQQSQIKAVIWRSNAERMDLNFLQDGLEVLCSEISTFMVNEGSIN